MINNIVKTKKIVNRGFLIGPYCPIYGFGGIFMSLVLIKYQNDPLVLFIMSMISFSILEYSTSLFMEKIFNLRWWDYSNKKYNIDGRVCADTMIPFGILGLIFMYLINPSLYNLINLIPHNTLMIISSLLLTIMIIDYIISFVTIYKLSQTNIKDFALKDNTSEITKLVKNEIINSKNKLQTRFIKAYPNIKLNEQQIKKKIEKRAKKAKEKQEKILKKIQKRKLK